METVLVLVRPLDIPFLYIVCMYVLHTYFGLYHVSFSLLHVKEHPDVSLASKEYNNWLGMMTIREWPWTKLITKPSSIVHTCVHTQRHIHGKAS